MSNTDSAAEMPSLVFGEEPENTAVQTMQAAPEPTKEELALTPEEQQMVNDFAEKIDISNTQAVLTYGAQTQKQLASFSEKTLDAVKTKDMGETGDLLTGLVKELQGFNDDEEQKGFLGFFKKKANSMQTLRVKYDSVEANVENVANELEKHEARLLADAKMYDRMYEMNLAYYKQLSMYILAGDKKLEEARTKDLTALQNKASKSGLPEDAQAAQDFADKCTRFEKKLYDLKLTRTIAMQTAPQIRMIQNSDIVMAEKIQSTIVNTIPLWKSQMVIAMGLEHASQAAEAEKQVSDMTSKLLKSNAEKLKTATVETAKESERGIVDIETLKATNDTLISAMDEVLAIQNEGKEKRREAEKELAEIERELKEKLLESANSNS